MGYTEKFPVGTEVRIADHEILENFVENWKLHNPLNPDQLKWAGKKGKIKKVGFYHGGDVLYEIDNILGIWHERCLEVPNKER